MATSGAGRAGGEQRLWPVIGLVVAAVLVAAAPGAWVAASNGAWTTGDEPHYLLTAISLGEDGDLDIADEWAARRWRPFHAPRPLQQAARRDDGGLVVPHDPLLPALLAGPMRLAGARGAKLALAGLAAALAGLTVWTGVRRFGLAVAPTAGVVALFGASVPLAPYATQVYPEVPAALAATAVVAACPGLPRRGPLVAVIAGVVALPWLGIKYVPVAAVLAGLVLVRLWRERPRTAVATAAVLAAAAAAYAAGHLAWYGGLTPYAASDLFQARGSQLVVVGGDPNYAGRAQRLIGLLVGRRFGLAAWQPAWLLVVPAAAALVRSRPRDWELLAAPLAAGWLVAVFVALTMQGWWVPGRQLVVVLPLAVLLVARWATADGRLWLVAGLGALGLWSYGWLVAAGLTDRLTWVVDFATTPDPWYRLWRLALPDYVAGATGTSPRHLVWLVAAAALARWGWRTAAAGGRVSRPVG